LIVNLKVLKTLTKLHYANKPVLEKKSGLYYTVSSALPGIRASNNQWRQRYQQ